MLAIGRHASPRGGFCSASWRLISLENLVEWTKNVRVKWIRPPGLCGAVTPMFVHPEPWRRILAHIRLKRIPARLRDLLMAHPGSVIDLRVKNDPVPSIRQRLTVRGNNRHARPFVQPGVRRSDAGF